MWQKFRHWFTPHYTNNYRAKLLHNLSLFILLLAVVGFHFSLVYLERSPLHILGFQSSITPEEVIKQTNLQRLYLGLPELRISQKLTQAAQAKANYMFSHNFWAHIAPDGTTPWKFILNAGYDYTYAGENLAKDFRDTSHLVRAWMNSPTHRANIISPKYQDIGVAVVPGKLLGKDTVLVVQMFGAKKSIKTTPPTITKTSASTQNLTSSTSAKTPVVAQVAGAKVSEFSLSKTISLVIIFLMLATLILDLIVAESKNLSRRVGKNWAHIIFINLILIALSIVHAGNIL